MRKEFIRAIKAPFFVVVAFLALELLLYFLVPKRLAEHEGIRYYPLNTVPNVEASVIQWKTYRLLKGPPENNGILFLGDSSCLMGVIPKIVQQDTGLSSWNLGTIGWIYTDGHADLLSLYLRRSNPPKVLVYHIFNYVLKTPWTVIRAQDNLRRFAIWSGEYQGSPLADRLPSSRAWYLAKYYVSWLIGLRKPNILNEPRGPFPSDLALRSDLESNRGYMPEPRSLKASASDLAPPRWTSDGMPGLYRILDLGQKYSFPVVIVINPLPQSLKNPDMDSAYQDLRSHLEKAISRYPQARIALSFPRYYPDALFGGIGHLNPSGAARNSHEIAAYLVGMGLTARRAAQASK